jgi:hypothetical protein
MVDGQAPAISSDTSAVLLDPIFLLFDFMLGFVIMEVDTGADDALGSQRRSKQTYTTAYHILHILNLLVGNRLNVYATIRPRTTLKVLHVMLQGP